MRTWLDRLYEAAGWLAAVFMIGTLVFVLLGILGRLFDFHVRGTDAYAGYCMAASGFLALAYTLRRNEHIRVTLLLESTYRGPRTRRSRSGATRSRQRSPRSSLSTASGSSGSRRRSTTSRPRTTPRRSGSRSSRWRPEP